MPVLLVVSLLFGLVCGCSPEGDSLVDDPAGLLDPAARERLARSHQVLLRDLDIHFKTVLLARPSADIDRSAVDLFDRYRLGHPTRAARGVLLLVDPKGGQVRLEIGYDLEGVFPDGFVGRVEREQMAPFFAAGRIGPGVEATVELLVARALEAGATGTGGERRGPTGGVGGRWSGGAGARIDVRPRSGQPQREAISSAARFTAQADPLATLQRYLEVLAGRVKDPDLGLYTPESRRFFRRWLVTDAQQAHEQRQLAAVLPRGRVVVAGDRAVVRFPVADRRAAPYLLQRGEAGWMLDIASMHRWIGCNHQNQWHFKAMDHPYRFAFADLRFDAHGFPHETGDLRTE